MVTFQIEKFQDIRADAEPLFAKHWHESALEKGRIRLNPDCELYQKMQDAGMIMIVTARRQRQLVGYHFLFIREHMHYANAGKMAYSDAYYLLPECRSGGHGAKLMAATEKFLREAGVVEFYSSCKVHQNIASLFEAMGFRLTDLMFRKALT